MSERGKHKKRKKHTNKYKRIRALLILITIVFIILIIRIVSKGKIIDVVNFGKGIYSHEKVNETSSFPTEVYGVPVHTQLIDENTNARPGTKRKIKYIVIHETDNFIEGTGAKNHAAFLSENNEEATSWHYTVDDTEIYHHIPDNEIANHAGEKTGNLYGIGIELCVNEDGDFEKTFENRSKTSSLFDKRIWLNNRFNKNTSRFFWKGLSSFNTKRR